MASTLISAVLCLFVLAGHVQSQILPPPIIYPKLYFQLNPRTAITIGQGNADVQVNAQDPGSVYNAFLDVIDYLDFVGGSASIKLQAGTYLVDNQINVGAKSGNTKFVGEGMNNTVLKFVDNSGFVGAGGSSMIKASLQKDFLISDMTLDGNMKGQPQGNNRTSGLYITGCTNAVVKNVRTTNFGKYGMVPHGYEAGNAIGSKLLVSNCMIDGNLRDGAVVYFYNNATFVDNFFKGNGGNGLLVTDDETLATKGVSVKGNTFLNNTEAGVSVANSSVVNIVSNQFFAGRNGVDIVNGTNCSVSLNKYYNVTGDIMIVANSSGVIVSNNYAERGDTCIDIAECASCSVTGNVCIRSSKNVIINSTVSVLQVNNTFSRSLLNMPPKLITAGYKGNEDFHFKAGKDTSDELQNALDIIDWNGGGRLELSEGIYLLSSQLAVGTNTIVNGGGLDRTVLKLIDYAPSFIIDERKTSGLVQAYLMTNITVANMTIDGNKMNQYNDANHTYGRFGFYIQACHDVVVDRVRVTSFQEYGFDPHGWKDAHIWSDNLTIMNSISDNNNWDGFTLDQTNNIQLINCTAYNNGRHGFNIVTGSQNTTLVNSSSYDNGFYYSGNTFAGGCGVIAQNNFDFNTGSVIIDNVHVRNASRAGICANGVFDAVITNNTIEVGPLCMEIVNTNGTRLENNVCNGTTRYISASGNTNNVLINNTYTSGSMGRQMVGVFSIAMMAIIIAAM
jgi:Right handed beta helix region